MSEISLTSKVFPADKLEEMLDRGARAIYAKRPFVTAMKSSPWDSGVMEATTFDWDGAPAYYQTECREIAAAVLNAALRPTP